MLRIIKNPVLTGFHPDPSLIRVGETFYLANSTFEWYPGVRIYESKNLKDWNFVSMPLDNLRLLDLRGIGSSEGIWAPDLSWHNGIFYLVYTVVRNQGRIKDLNNYLVTAPSVKGPWSQPVYLNSSGFDPSLFHDEDGKKWLVNMLWDYRKGKGPECFTGILLQEYDSEKKMLIGSPRNIYKGTALGYTEGPHLYKKDGYYYLMCAEGGTSYEHAVTVARSRNIDGPYETDPQNPMLTSAPESYLKKAGHASLVQGPEGGWYIAHLCGRPIPGTKSCVLGRETAIQAVKWTKEGWLRLRSGKTQPEDAFRVDNVFQEGEKEPKKQKLWEYSFKDKSFLADFQTLRIPYDPEMMSLDARRGWLRLTGMEGIQSRFCQSLLARRQQDFSFTAKTKMEYSPTDFQHSAGLIYRYNEDNLYYLFVTYNEEIQSKTIDVCRIYAGEYTLLYEMPVQDDEKEYILGIDVDWYTGRFFMETDGKKCFLGPIFDVTNLSDDFTFGFTGAFVGICAQDLREHRKWADFQWFQYESR
ncbi:MAG TPA: glycoside hydrolase family 43 protein [Candidatus Blautia faecavium]|uniref:Glycoside hydrolase family 43 protein n=1 Tax=Candidatus Blautia faecavium TaxID=2838487 RepID=A0A9D2LT61_9FIRM|nr:glycoside hydrolase family 43 protein [Candidatus Blautia faecavium]